MREKKQIVFSKIKSYHYVYIEIYISLKRLFELADFVSAMWRYVGVCGGLGGMWGYVCEFRFTFLFCTFVHCGFLFPVFMFDSCSAAERNVSYSISIICYANTHIRNNANGNIRNIYIATCGDIEKKNQRKE